MLLTPPIMRKFSMVKLEFSIKTGLSIKMRNELSTLLIKSITYNIKCRMNSHSNKKTQNIISSYINPYVEN